MMQESDRVALAIDIASRVRLLCVQPAPEGLLDALKDGSRHMMRLYTNNATSDVLMETWVNARALHITFRVNGNQVGWFRFDAEPPRDE